METDAVADVNVSRQVELNQEEIELVCYLAKFFRGMCILQNGGGAIVSRTAALNDRMESLLLNVRGGKEPVLSNRESSVKPIRAEKGAVSAGAAPSQERSTL